MHIVTTTAYCQVTIKSCGSQIRGWGKRVDIPLSSRKKRTVHFARLLHSVIADISVVLAMQSSTIAIAIEFNLVTRHFIRSYFPSVSTMRVNVGENADGSLRADWTLTLIRYDSYRGLQTNSVRGFTSAHFEFILELCRRVRRNPNRARHSTSASIKADANVALTGLRMKLDFLFLSGNGYVKSGSR